MEEIGGRSGSERESILSLKRPVSVGALWALGLQAAMLVTLGGSALASTHLVPEEFPTIQAAIDACGQGDSVSIASGTYTGAANVSLTIPPIGLTIASRSDRDATILDGEWQWSAGSSVSGTSDPPIVLSGLTIRRCFTALRLEQANPILSNLVLLENSVWDFLGGGGGIRCIDSTPRLIDVLFQDNYAGEAGGGGLFCYGVGRPELTRVQFVSNESVGLGSGMACLGDVLPLFTEVTFLNNLSGLYLAVDGRVELTGLEFRGNVGGLIVGGYDSITPEVVISGCQFIGNAGRAVHCDGPSIVSIESSTIVFGDASLGGMAAIDIGEGGQLTLTRSIVAFNENQLGVAWDGSGPAPVIECSDVFANSLGNYSPEIGEQTGINGNISADPIFCGAINDPAFSFSLEAASPCLPAGNPCGVLMGAFGQGCDAVDVEGELPGGGPALLGNYPNPFAPETQIVFSLPAASVVSATIYDVSGRRMATLLAGERLERGVHRLPWQALNADGEALPAGVYPYVLEIDGERSTGKLLVVR